MSERDVVGWILTLTGFLAILGMWLGVSMAVWVSGLIGVIALLLLIFIGGMDD